MILSNLTSVLLYIYYYIICVNIKGWVHKKKSYQLELLNIDLLWLLVERKIIWTQVINCALIAKQFAIRKLNQFFNHYTKDRYLNKCCQQLRNTNLRFCISSSTQASNGKLDQNYFKRA
jgi:hypothetical protein